MNRKHGQSATELRCERAMVSFRDQQFDCGLAGRNDEYRTQDSQLRLCKPSLRARLRRLEAELTHYIPVGYEGGCFPGAIDRG